jgi:hypothetical protein
MEDDEEISEEEREELAELNQPPPGVDSKKFVDDGEGLEWEDKTGDDNEEDE